MEVTLYNILYIIHILYIFHRFAKHPDEARRFHRLDVRLILNDDLGESVETKIYKFINTNFGHITINHPLGYTLGANIVKWPYEFAYTHGDLFYFSSFSVWKMMQHF